MAACILIAFCCRAGSVQLNAREDIKPWTATYDHKCTLNIIQEPKHNTFHKSGCHSLSVCRSVCLPVCLSSLRRRVMHARSFPSCRRYLPAIDRPSGHQELTRPRHIVPVMKPTDALVLSKMEIKKKKSVGTQQAIKSGLIQHRSQCGRTFHSQDTAGDPRRALRESHRAG